jgi:hypothetical protein
MNLNYKYTFQLSILGPGLVRRERLTTSQGDTVLIKPVTMVPNVIELSDYANTCSNVYRLEAVAGIFFFFFWF